MKTAMVAWWYGKSEWLKGNGGDARIRKPMRQIFSLRALSTLQE
jgi:hypothetical protein